MDPVALAIEAETEGLSRRNGGAFKAETEGAIKAETEGAFEAETEEAVEAQG